MKLRLLVAVTAVLAFLSCQKSVSENIDDPSQNLVGTYDFVGMTSIETEIMNDTISGMITKYSTVDSNQSTVCQGTLQVTAGQFIYTNFDVSGITYARSVSEIEGHQPHFEEFTEEFGPYNPDSYTCDYKKLGLDSIRLTYLPDPGDPSSAGTETHHYRYSGDTLILTLEEKKSYYVNEQGRQSSYEETFWQIMKFKRKN